MPSSPPPYARLPWAGRLVIAAAVLGAALAVTVVAGSFDGPTLNPLVLGLLGVVCAASAFEALLPNGHSSHSNLVFFFWGALMVPVAWLPLLAVLCFVPAAVARRERWYLGTFNAANYTLAGTAAFAVVASAAGVGAVALSVFAFVVVNHLLLGIVIVGTNRGTAREAARASTTSLPLDLALAATGACLSVLWTSSPAAALLAIGPIALVYRALLVPSLEHQSRTDPKTGLFNSEWFERQLRDELRTARKRGEQLAVVMVDLDHLRAVNNRFGHLVGDEAIRRVASILQTAPGSRSLAARFGGEEFCVLVPGVSGQQAEELAERLRLRVEESVWEHEGEHVAVTLSAGVATFPEHGETPRALLAAADQAVYDAKVSGRNRVRVALARSARGALGLDPVAPAPMLAPILAPPVPELSAAALAAIPPAEEAAESTPEPTSAKHARLLPGYITLLLLAAGLVGFVSDASPIVEQPALCAALIACVLGLDLIRIDLFERARISPASAPTLALAYFFGPLGVIAAEAVIAVKHVVLRESPRKIAFDLGALSLSGAAASVVFALMPTSSPVEILLAGPIAGIAYYAVNVSLLSIVMALNEGASPIALWRERLAWLVPHYLLYGAIGAGLAAVEQRVGLSALAVFALPVVTLWLAQKQYVARSRASVAELRERHDQLEEANTRLERLLDEKKRLMQRMQKSYLSTITSLARTIEAKDPYTGGHTERVCRVSLLLATELGLTETQLQAVEVGAVIHDVGKIGVPDDILLKPGKLSGDELLTMRRHPEISSYIIGELDVPTIVKQMVRNHHERYDGTGYPDRLVGEEIPLAARILAVADTLDAMTTTRPYQAARPLAEAVEEIEQMAGTQFCPRVVEALLSCLERDPSLNGMYDEAVVEPVAEVVPLDRDKRLVAA